MIGQTRRNALAVLGGGFAMAGIGPTNAAEQRGTVFTADEGSGTISAVNLATGQVSATPVSIAPHNVQAADRGQRLLAVGVGHSAHAAGRHGPSGQLVVLRTNGGAAPHVLAEVGVGRHPAHVVADESFSRAFVTDAEANAVLVVDLQRERVSDSIRVGRYPHGLRMSPNGRDIWVANVRDGTVSIVDASRGTETARIAVGPSPIQVGFVPDGSRAFVSLRGSNAVAEIDTASHQVARRIAVGASPAQVFASPDGRFVYVANEGTRARPGISVSAVEVSRGAVVATIETGRGAHGIVMNPDSSRAFVTNVFDDTLAEIDVAAQRVVRTFRVGRSPNGVTWSDA